MFAAPVSVGIQEPPQPANLLPRGIGERSFSNHGDHGKRQGNWKIVQGQALGRIVSCIQLALLSSNGLHQ